MDKNKVDESQSDNYTNIKSSDSNVQDANVKRNMSITFLKNQTTYYQPCSGKFRSSKKMKISPMCIPSSFSLVNLHNHLLGFPPSKSHGAEADCLTLLRTTAALGQVWLDWVDANCYLIESCKKMWHMG